MSTETTTSNLTDAERHIIECYRQADELDKRYIERSALHVRIQTPGNTSDTSSAATVVDINRFESTLPHPFSSVSVVGYVFEKYVELVYVGPGAQLVDSGSVEPHMIELAEKRGATPRVDSQGHYFIRAETTKGRMRITRRITDMSFARQLPGVPTAICCSIIDWLDAHPGQLWVEDHDLESADHMSRHETYGTKQSLVAAGFDASWFTGHFGVHTRGRLIPTPNHDWVWVYKLIGGYFRVEQETMKAKSVEKVIPMGRNKMPAMRLVWSNPA